MGQKLKQFVLTKSKKKKFEDLCEHYFKFISKDIETSLKFNHSLDFPTSNFCERLNFVLHNVKGYPANFLWDAENKSEVKGCNYTQSVKCHDCGKRNNYYSKNCWSCKSEEFIFTKDARWGIDTHAHFKYIEELSYYLFVSIYPLNKEIYSPHFRLQVFKVDSNEEFFNKVLAHQKKFGEKQKNFMPYSRDFYLSSPSELLNVDIEIKNTITFKYNLEKEKKIISFPVENKIPIEKTVITKKELINLGLEKDDEGILNLLELLNANPEPCNPCSHGKNRGLTTRGS